MLKMCILLLARKNHSEERKCYEKFKNVKETAGWIWDSTVIADS